MRNEVETCVENFPTSQLEEKEKQFELQREPKSVRGEFGVGQ